MKLAGRSRWLFQAGPGAIALAGALTLGVLGAAEARAAEASQLSDAEFERAKFIYFDRCSGCHGALRKGATGPNITDAEMNKKTPSKLEKTIYDGTEAGMPGWGRTGEMTRAETAPMAKCLQMPAPVPRSWASRP
jgi:nitrite reductase (NO-forming)/hydroxylamine reductase